MWRRPRGCPWAGENCSPNLYVLVSVEPQQLLQAMAKRNYGFTFGYHDAPSPKVINAFITTPRPVRVWYTSQERDLEGFTLIRGPDDEPANGSGDRIAADDWLDVVPRARLRGGG